MHYSLGHFVGSSALLQPLLAIVCVVNQLDGTGSAAVKACQTLLEEYDDLDADVNYLDSNFVGLKLVIKTFEKDGLSLAEANGK